MSLPECGLYRTTVAIAGVSAGTLVFFHNHGDPGPGVYVPTSWANNRATFSKNGTTLPDNAIASTLQSLPPEGLYRVVGEITCCDKRCRTYASETLVQLGYNGKGEGILFLPTLSADGVQLPSRGTRIEDDRFDKLQRLIVAPPQSEAPVDPSSVH